LRKLNTEPSIGASHQVSVHLTKQFQRRRFLEINQPETRIAYSSHEHSVKNHSLDVLKIKHLELNEKMEYTVTGAIILILYLESLIQRERKSKPTLHFSKSPSSL
jgi:hypothetical protein